MASFTYHVTQDILAVMLVFSIRASDTVCSKGPHGNEQITNEHYKVEQM